MRTSVFFSTLFVASALSVTLAQTNPPIVDDDGILNIVDTPFDINRFVIGRDFHENKFADQDKGLQGMADCFFQYVGCLGRYQAELQTLQEVRPEHHCVGRRTSPHWQGLDGHDR